MSIKEITYEEFENALQVVLSQDLLIISHARAGKGYKKISFNPSKGLFTVQSSKTEPHTTFSPKAAYEVYENIKV